MRFYAGPDKKRVGPQAMVRAAIKEADELQRRPYVPEQDRTPDRDDAADWLEAELVDGDRSWGQTTIVELSEASGNSGESGYSREHIARTLDKYFDPKGGGRSAILEELASAAVTESNRSDDYEGGFQDGFETGLKFALEHEQLLNQ